MLNVPNLKIFLEIIEAIFMKGHETSFSKKELVKIHYRASLIPRNDHNTFIPEYLKNFPEAKPEMESILSSELKFINLDAILEYEDSVVIVDAYNNTGSLKVLSYNRYGPSIEEAEAGFDSRFQFFTRLMLYRDVIEKFTGKRTSILLLTILPSSVTWHLEEVPATFRKLHNDVARQMTMAVNDRFSGLNALNNSFGVRSKSGIRFTRTYHMGVEKNGTDYISLQKVYLNKYGMLSAKNDRAIRNEYIIVKHGSEHNEEWSDLYVQKVYWLGPHKPKTEMKKVVRLKAPENSQKEIHRTMHTILNDPQYFNICSHCGERNQIGHMFNDVLCQGCATMYHGVVY